VLVDGVFGEMLVLGHHRHLTSRDVLTPRARSLTSAQVLFKLTKERRQPPACTTWTSSMA
jgi:hypothetical protein